MTKSLSSKNHLSSWKHSATTNDWCFVLCCWMIGLSNACYSQCYHRGATDVSCIIVTRLNPVYLSHEMQYNHSYNHSLQDSNQCYQRVWFIVRLGYRASLLQILPFSFIKLQGIWGTYSMDTERKILGYNLEIDQMHSSISSIYFTYKISFWQRHFNAIFYGHQTCSTITTKSGKAIRPA
jgi:hypothetical protein